MILCPSCGVELVPAGQRAHEVWHRRQVVLEIGLGTLLESIAPATAETFYQLLREASEMSNEDVTSALARLGKLAE